MLSHYAMHYDYDELKPYRHDGGSSLTGLVLLTVPLISKGSVVQVNVQRAWKLPSSLL